MDDMAIRGRAKYVRGERHGKSKLTEHQVLSIRSMYTAGYRQADIARHYGVTQANIGEIIKGKTWQHLLG
jgi:DNA-binding MarR family transcriptional regulator